MLMLAFKMLLHRRWRCLLASVGIGAAFFLSASQIGLLVGWCGTCSAIIRQAGVDVWVMAPHTPAFDYGTPIPRHRIHQVRNAPGVAWAEGMFQGLDTWQRADGRRVNVELVGLDDGLAGGPWQMAAGSVDVVCQRDTIIVDQMYLQALGVAKLGDDVEMIGQRAVVGGICRDVRTLTASPFVFTSLKSAIRYDRRYREDEITYVLARCAPGQSADEVAQAIREAVPHVEVLTTKQFAARTMKYWMLETGLGVTVAITAVLGLGVGAVITSQTLFAMTQDYLSNYATLLALGFGRSQLASIVGIQSLVLGIGGILLGSAAYGLAAHLSAPTPIPLVTTPLIFASLMGFSLACCVTASLASIRSLFRINPVAVFRN